MNESKSKVLGFRPTSKLNTIISDTKLNEEFINPWKVCHIPWHRERRHFTLINKLKFVRKNLVEQTESYQNFDITYLVKGELQFIAAFLSFALHMVWQLGLIRFLFSKKCKPLLSFSERQEHTTPIFKTLKILKLHDIIQFVVFKLIYFYHIDQSPSKIKNIFTQNESINAYNTRDGKLFY